MYLEILAILILLASALLHVRAGIWAAVMSLWMILVSGAVAVGFYLPLRSVLPWGADPLSMSYYWLDGLVLLLLFVAAFGLLRLLFVRTLRQRMKMPALVDTIGGGIVGGVAGFFAAGIIALAAQMMAMPPSVLGYEPFDLMTGERQDRLLLRYDDAVLGMYSGLSRGALSADAIGLPGRYPNRNPAGAAESSDAEVRKHPYRGRNHEDILYSYFRRRVNLALLLGGEKGPMESSEKGGVALISGESKVLRTERRAPGVLVKVHEAFIVPSLVYVGKDELAEPEVIELFSGNGISPGSAGGFNSNNSNGNGNDEGTSPDGADGNDNDVSSGSDEGLNGSGGNALLLVDVSFGPEAADQAMVVHLRDWHLSSNIAAGSKDANVPGPKLLKVSDETGKLEVLGEEVWEFSGDKDKARAMLAFLVPSLSHPMNYALRCEPEFAAAGTGEATSSGRSPDANGSKPEATSTNAAKDDARAAVNGRTHHVSFGEVSSPESADFMLPSGRIRPRRLSEAANQKYLIVPLKLRPKKSDDESYYYVLPVEMTVRLGGKGAESSPVGARFEGEDAFISDKALTERLRFTGEKTIEFIYIISGESEAITINAIGRPQEVPK